MNRATRRSTSAFGFAASLLGATACLGTPGGGFGDDDDRADGGVDVADSGDGDSDGDGWNDADEIAAHTDPDDPDDHPYEFGGYPMDPCRNDIVPTGYSPGDITPSFVMPDQYGQAVRLHDFCDHIVLLTIGAMWCGACMTAAEHLSELYEELRDVGLWPMEISAWGPEGDPCTVEDLAGWAERYDLVTPVLWDDTYSSTSEYIRQGNGLPHRVLIAPGMEIVTIGAYGEDELREMILEIAAR